MKSNIRVASVVTLLSIAGLAHSALAQQADPRRIQNNTNQPNTQNNNQNVPANQARQNDKSANNAWSSSVSNDFRSCDRLTGNDIVDRSNEKVGEIADFIIERGTGRITHVVVDDVPGRTGSALVPYAQLRWDSANGRLVSPVSADAMRSFPAFSESEWTKLRASSRPDTNARNIRMPAQDRPMQNQPAQPSTRTNDPATNTNTNTTATTATITPPGNAQQIAGRSSPTDPVDRNPNDARDLRDIRSDRNLSDSMWRQPNQGDPFSSQWDSGQTVKIEGEIRQVHRQYTRGMGEQVIVDIATADGAIRKVALGPSWFVGGGQTSLNRGERISVEAVTLNVATAATVNGQRLTLRSEDGAGAWNSDTFKAGSESYSAPYYRNTLLTTVRKATLDCRGTTCGTVNDLVLEMNSGTVAFLSIDPNQNFMGIADTKRLIPWAVTTISVDGKVRLDVAKEMVLASVETPSDLTALNTSGQADMIYNAFQIQPRDYSGWREESQEENGRYWDTNTGTINSINNPNDRNNPNNLNDRNNPNDRTRNDGTTTPRR